MLGFLGGGSSGHIVDSSDQSDDDDLSDAVDGVMSLYTHPSVFIIVVTTICSSIILHENTHLSGPSPSCPSVFLELVGIMSVTFYIYIL